MKWYKGILTRSFIRYIRGVYIEDWQSILRLACINRGSHNTSKKRKISVDETLTTVGRQMWLHEFVKDIEVAKKIFVRAHRSVY